MGEDQLKQEQDTINKMLEKSLQQQKQQETTRVNKESIDSKSSMLTDQGMTIFVCIIVLVLARIFIRKKIIRNVINAVCVFGLYLSGISYLGIKFNSKLPSILGNLLILLVVILYVIRKKRSKNNER